MTLFHLSLAVSTILLIVALICVRFIKNGWTGITQLTIAMILASLLSRGSAVVAVQGAMILVFSICAYWGKWSFRSFAAITVGLSVLNFSLFCVAAFREIEDYRARRERMTMELVSERLPAVKQSAKVAILSTDTKAQIELIERKLDELRQPAEEHLRSLALHTLRRQTMESFVSSSGFGVRRIISRPTEERIDLPPPPPIPQPAPLSESDRAYSLVGAQPADGLRPGLSAFHLGSLLNFVNVRGFGLLTEEKRLFGFQPHHFRKLPDTEEWQVRSLELVGLVVHEQPRVYETKELPRMDKIRDIPTRALDAFEAAGLESFKAGEDLYVRSMPLGVRMLGAIRSVEQCVKCHGGERGDLLGAFSYSLQKKQ